MCSLIDVGNTPTARQYLEQVKYEVQQNVFRVKQKMAVVQHSAYNPMSMLEDYHKQQKVEVVK